VDSLDKSPYYLTELQLFLYDIYVSTNRVTSSADKNLMFISIHHVLTPTWRKKYIQISFITKCTCVLPGKAMLSITLFSILETACSMYSFRLPDRWNAGLTLSPSMPIAPSPGNVWATLRKVAWNFKNNQQEGSKLEEAVAVEVYPKGF
jgi:hypothetical protein